MTPRRSVLVLALAATLASACGDRSPAPSIAAASDLQAALPEAAAAFRRSTGHEVRLTFGSSGALAQQILNGAPYEVFLSADEAYVERLRAAGRTEGPGALYAEGRIGVFAARGSPVTVDPELAGLARALEAGQVEAFAIANPAHAPYGRAAREALQAAGLWRAVEPRLVLGENVSQAAQFAASGAAQGGLIPLSLALTPQVRQAGSFNILPAAMHAPLRQRAVVIRGASPAGRAFFDYLQGSEGQAILARHGFSRPAR